MSRFIQSRRVPFGYTLMEILVSIALIMVLMAAMSRLFAEIGREINNTQKVMLMSGGIRNTTAMLSRDLSYLSAPLSPPGKYGDNIGYFCFIEGRYPIVANSFRAITETGAVDNTAIDNDDILMFTVKAPLDSPFRGLLGGSVYESTDAEIIWFVRGNTLYRRVLLIVPDEVLQAAIDFLPAAVKAEVKEGKGFYRYFDVSAHVVQEGSGTNATYKVVANTLDDLTRRERRFAHAGLSFPSDIHKNNANYLLGMPTLQENSAMGGSWAWDIGKSIASQYDRILGNSGDLTALTYRSGLSGTGTDFWEEPNPWDEVDPTTGLLIPATVLETYSGIYATRPGEDVVLTNVIGFDVKIWDDATASYVDLGTTGTNFTNVSFPNSSGTGINLLGVYDTWTDRYERYAQSGAGSNRIGKGLNQLDDDGDGFIDNMEEWEYPPPYMQPLRSVQVTIRVCDGLNRKHIRQMTIVVDFEK